jgi:hypothetical protein
MHIEGEYVLAADEYANALKVTRAHRRWISLALAGIFAVLGVVLVVEGNPEPGGFFLVLAPVYLLMVPWEIKAARNKFARRTDGLATTAVFTDAAFATRTPTQTVEIAWQACLETVETPEFFLIYASNRTIAVVPKRAFSPADLAALSDFLRDVVPATEPRTLA